MSDGKTEKGSRTGIGESQSPLGKASQYPETYQAELLYPIARAEGRRVLGLQGEVLPFMGRDLWTAYELSWLNCHGVPQVAIGEFAVPCTSRNIVESKSLKLYLNSLNQTAFDSQEIVAQTIQKDLGTCCDTEVSVSLFSLDEYAVQGLGGFAGKCVDQLTLTQPVFEPSPSLLKHEDSSQGEGEIEECLYSHLLKTNCPVTGQPDWASVALAYRGERISPSSFLAYIVSFRHHQDFHEHCVERIFLDVQEQLAPSDLTVYARYVRRGGLDINPYRSTLASKVDSMIKGGDRLARQ